MTQSEIARLAEVSIGTVDRVLHERGKVSRKNRQKIEEVIKQYGYEPNIIARHLKQKTILKVGVLLPGYRSDSSLPFPHSSAGSTYYGMIMQGIEQAAKTLRPFNIKIMSTFWGYSEGIMFPEASGRLLEQGIDALIFSPAAPKEAREMLANMGAIPYVLVDSPLAGAAPLATITQDPWRGGQSAARLMRLLKGTGHFVCLRISGDAYNLTERVRGFSDFFAGDSSVRISQVQSDSFISASVFSLLDRLFAAERIDGIFVPHAEVHVVAEYLAERGLKPRVSLIGYDNVPLNRQALLDGAIDCLIAQRPETQGSLAVNEIYHKCILNKDREPVVEIPIDIYLKENVCT
jgi:LacI family transcriptional regulator